MSRLTTKKLTLVALLASVYAIGSFLPGFPMLGVSGSKIDIVRAIEMSYGLILGPVLGPITAFLGAVVGKTLTGSSFGMYFTPLAFVSSFVAACLMKEKVFGLAGWIPAAGVSGIMIIGFYVSSLGMAIPAYPIFHIIGLGVILFFRERLYEYLQSDDRKKLAIGVALSSYSATMAGHMLGNLIFTLLVGGDPLFYMTILPVTIAERLFITALSAILGVPLILVIRSTYPNLLKD